MEGFYITISNGLLSPKHYEGIGEAIWLFLWYLDKMTVIDHDKGEGKVLGGKPIKFEEIQKDLGISRSTYKRWINGLRDNGYILTKRTGYGLIVTVYKAKKVFNQAESRRVINGPSGKADGSHVVQQMVESGPSNKTKQLDKTTNSSTDVELEKQVNKIMNIFYKEINPTISFGSKMNRDACLYLLKKFGVENTHKLVKACCKVQGKKYAPTITTPYQLKDKLAKLKIYFDREKENNKPRIADIKFNKL